MPIMRHNYRVSVGDRSSYEKQKLETRIFSCRNCAKKKRKKFKYTNCVIYNFFANSY